MRVLVAMVWLVGVAHADPRTAAVHDRQAKAYFEAKQYDAAIDEFKKSYAQDKKPLTLFKIASAYYAKADFAAAIDFYGQYLQADPNGSYAQQALEFTTIAKRALDDRKAAEDARIAAAEVDKKRLVAAGRIKNAEAFAKEGAWTSAGDEYRAATEIDGDPAHLLDAAAAYRKQPDHAKASEAYRAYLDKVPAGANSDEARSKLAESARALEAAEAEKARVAEQQPPKRDEPEVPTSSSSITKGWSSFGPRIAGGVSEPASNPLKMDSRQGLVLGPSFDLGGFARYQLHARIAVRPEANIVYRKTSFDGNEEMGGNNALTFTRAGISIAAPFYFSLQAEDGFRVGAGPFMSAYPVWSVDAKAGFSEPLEASRLDYGFLAALELDLGLVSIEVRLAKSFGAHAGDFEPGMHTLLAGLAFGFEPAR